MSRGVAAKAPASRNAGTSVHRPAIITCGSMSTVAWNLRSIVSCAAKQIDTPNASRLPSRRPESMASPNMMTMPANATVIASHVRVGTGSFSTSLPEMAARNGDTLISTNVLATVVCVSDAMKKKNVPERNSPESNPGQPTRRTARGIRRPCITSSTPATKAAMNSERQKTISQVLVIDSCRTRMPPDDQQTAATIMNRTARR